MDEIERVRAEASNEVAQLKAFLGERARQVGRREAELERAAIRLEEQAARLRRRRDALRADKRRRTRVLGRLEERRKRDDLLKREQALQLEAQLADLARREAELPMPKPATRRRKPPAKPVATE
jgi:hypothetical protein